MLLILLESECAHAALTESLGGTRVAEFADFALAY
jgi:hypothetical protein